ncbi:MAG TPA: O-antigen ligase family protein [Burkholderiales bacterium]|nr:O-antigen ligase family protein [Burkholderiales bacterium]
MTAYAPAAIYPRASLLSVRALRLCAFFVISLYPIVIGDSGIGANYSFVLLPLAVAMVHGSVRRPPSGFLYLIMMYTAIFVIAAVYQYEFYQDGGRRLASFILFMTMFAYAFVDIDEVMVRSFAAAVVIMSILLSLSSVVIFFVAGGSSLGFEAKNVVGSQRVGFLYLFALWIVYLQPVSGIARRVAKQGIAIVLLVGLFLTFSRSSVIALLGSMGLFWLVGFGDWLRKPRLRAVLVAVAILAATVLALGLVWWLVPVVFDFFDTRLFEYALNSDVVDQDLSNEHSSGGTRIFLWRHILDFVADNPLTGTGYLGVWSIVGSFSGSAHNQYADVLLRTGVPGLLAYLGLLAVLLRYLRRVHRGFFWGLIAVLIYGMLHETFKETHGTFMLAFLLGMMAGSPRRRLPPGTDGVPRPPS